MKIEIKFAYTDESDSMRYPAIDGKVITMEGIDDMYLSTAIDLLPDGKGSKEPGNTGSIELNVHGLRAVWS